MKKVTTTDSKNTTYNPYIIGNATQEWIDKEKQHQDLTHLMVTSLFLYSIKST